MTSCPANYKKINQGCYFFGQASNLDWNSAVSYCANNLNQTNIVTHLISFESDAEIIGIYQYLRTSGLTNSYWTDGTKSNENDNIRVWEWNYRTFETFGYVKQRFTGKKNVYLKYNLTQQYELDDDDGKSQFNYICEAQGTLI